MGLLFGSPRRAEAPAEGSGESRGMTWPFPSGTGQYAANVAGDGALQSIAVRSSIDLICSLMSELPAHVYSGDGHQRRKRRTPGNIEDPGNDGHGLEDWVYQLGQSWLGRGNAFGDVVSEDRVGRPRQMAWFHPDEVRPNINPGTGRVEWTVNGKPFTREMKHYRVNPVPGAGHVLGLSPIALHATQIGTSISAAQFGEGWFADGAHPSALLTNELADLNPEQTATVKARWMALFKGNREPAVMGKGWDYKPIQVTPEESQFLGTQGFTEAQCARIFGPAVAETLGYESGTSMTYANVVDRRSDLLTFTVNRWLRRAERILTSLLPEPQYLRFDRDALLESSTLARYEAHQVALRNRFRTVNEVRDDEDLPPVSWGDEPNATTATAAQQTGGN